MRRVLALLCPVALVVLPALPASAAVTAEFALGILTVTGDGDANSITVECVGGDVLVNGSAPSGGAVDCSSVETMLVRAGGGADRVSLADVRAGAFTRLAKVGVFGEEGDDTLIGSGLGDRMDGGAGLDVLRGGSGNDVLEGGLGGGQVFGGGGRDTIFGAGSGSWRIDADALVRLDPPEETTFSGIERAEVVGGGGDDVVRSGSFTGPVKVNGGDGDDLISTGGGPDHLIGGGGNDDLASGGGNDLLEGKAGNDVLRAGAGNDQMRGGPGDDVCTGGPGADSEVSC
jgi:Ca2+-binding RTX toxin-like protein